MNVVKTLLAMLVLSASLGGAERPSEIPLWPQGAPGSEGKPMKELVTTTASGELSVSGIHNPSITPYLPTKDKATGPAILVIPGGGHRVLAITHEGYNVAEWLRDRGIAAFVLKHRLAREANSTYKIEVESFADTKRALRLIRSRAAEWNIDPARVGAIGFSAGGELVSMASTRGPLIGCRLWPRAPARPTAARASPARPAQAWSSPAHPRHRRCSRRSAGR